MDPLGLEGTWRPIRAESQGELAPSLALEKIRLIFRGGCYRFELDREQTDSGKCVVREPASAGRLDLHGTHGLNTGRRIPALFQLRGDLLRICFGFDGSDPNDFTAPANSGRYLATYRRVTASELD